MTTTSCPAVDLLCRWFGERHRQQFIRTHELLRDVFGIDDACQLAAADQMIEAAKHAPIRAVMRPDHIPDDLWAAWVDRVRPDLIHQIDEET
jgi:hypothetical protein